MPSEWILIAIAFAVIIAWWRLLGFWKACATLQAERDAALRERDQTQRGAQQAEELLTARVAEMEGAIRNYVEACEAHESDMECRSYNAANSREHKDATYDALRAALTRDGGRA